MQYNNLLDPVNASSRTAVSADKVELCQGNAEMTVVSPEALCPTPVLVQSSLIVATI